QDATEMILALAAGYPYDIHLIGDAAFSEMDKANRMQPSDVLRGIAELFRSDKREKYFEKLRQLSDGQRLAVVSLARYSSKRIPFRIPLDWLENNLLGSLPASETIAAIIDELVKDGILIVNNQEGVCQFAEELFRIFIALLVRDQGELENRKRIRAEAAETKKHHVEQFQARQRLLLDAASYVLEDKGIA